MDFTKALEVLEKGYKIRRPKWSGCLFLDVDGNIRYLGKNHHERQFWTMDISESDWRKAMHDKVNLKSDEITQARLESLMDCNESHLKRLYYLEDIIETQHKAFKKLSENNIAEMDETRKALEKIVRNIPRIESKINDLADKFYRLELQGLISSVNNLIKKNPIKKEEKPVAKTVQSVKLTPNEQKEMEEVREKYNTRLALKAKSVEKTTKRDKRIAVSVKS